jgi:hypothetical protein
MSQLRRASFVVRVVEDRRGEVRGVIERVATGAKEAFTGTEAIGQLIVRMVLQEVRALRRAGSGAPPTSEDQSCPDERPGGGSVPRGASD